MEEFEARVAEEIRGLNSSIEEDLENEDASRMVTG
jgi:hypothetical protein